jgi:hypothetical protein
MTTDDDVMSQAEQGRSIARIERMLDDLTKEFRQEMRETRHKAANAMQGVELQRYKNEAFDRDISRIDKTVHETLFPKVDDLVTNAASQEAVDKYRRWFIGTLISVGGLGVVNLVINLSQGGVK